MNHRVSLAVVLLLTGALAFAWTAWKQRQQEIPPGFAMSNGRLEAREMHVGSKIAGRVAEVRVQEGDVVSVGDVLVRLEDQTLRAQLAAAEAQVEQARQALVSAEAALQKAEADAQLARSTLQRTERLAANDFLAQQKLDVDRAAAKSAAAAVALALAKREEVRAALAAAQAQVQVAASALADTVITAPRAGRVQHRLVEPGEVIAAGGRVVTLLDLDAVEMTVYLPTAVVGRLAIGDEARIVADAWLDQPIPAQVIFIADKAQFTPREVETASEREKLTFRVKIAPQSEWLRAHRDQVKSGMPGVAIVRTDSNRPWSEILPLLQ